MHASFLHIAGNMLFLWIFGNNVEDAMGPIKYFFFYIARRDRRPRPAGRDQPERGRAHAGRLGRDRRSAGRLHPAVSTGAGPDPDLHHPVLHRDRVTRASLVLGLWFAEQTVFAAVGLTNPRRERRRRLLRARRRVRVRPGHGQAAGHPAAPWSPNRNGYPVLLTALRLAVFTVALLFIGALGVLTVRDVRMHGATPVDVLAIVDPGRCSPPASSAPCFILRGDERAPGGTGAATAAAGGRASARRRCAQGWSSCSSPRPLCSVLMASGRRDRPVDHPGRSFPRAKSGAGKARSAKLLRNRPRARRRPVTVKLKLPLSSGLLFDVRTGKVLWARNQASGRSPWRA